MHQQQQPNPPPQEKKLNRNCNLWQHLSFVTCVLLLLYYYFIFAHPLCSEGPNNPQLREFIKNVSKAAAASHRCVATPAERDTCGHAFRSRSIERRTFSTVVDWYREGDQSQLRNVEGRGEEEGFIVRMTMIYVDKRGCSPVSLAESNGSPPNHYPYSNKTRASLGFGYPGLVLVATCIPRRHHQTPLWLTRRRTSGLRRMDPRPRG